MDLGRLAQAPAYDVVGGESRFPSDKRLEGIALLSDQALKGTGSPTVDRFIRAVCVEGYDPSTYRLQSAPADGHRPRK